MKNLLLLVALFVFNTAVFAQGEVDSLELKKQEILASFKYQTGTITLGDNVAKIAVPAGLKYLNPEQSDFVLTELWGNPKGEPSLGLLFLENATPLDSNALAFDISYEAIGYVKDDEAAEINYDDLLVDMKKDVEEANKVRTEAGYEPVALIGWAAKPFYDKDKHVLHWAKEVKFGEASVNTLNYNIRLLGRKGVLQLNAISSITQLPEVNKHIPALISSVSFENGLTYTDFNPELDEVAAYGIGGLIAGKVLTKVGFFAVLLKFWKFIIVGIGAAGSYIWRLVTGRRKEEEEAVPVATADEVEPEQKA